MVADGSGRAGRARRAFAAAAALLAGLWLAAITGAQQPSATAYDPDPVELDHPAIGYRLAPRTDAVAELNRRLMAGTAALKFEGPSGYLRSLLELLDIPVDSQMAVYSKTSLQTPIISPANPRTIFFNDTVAVGWMRGGMIEVAALDPAFGVGFYVLPPVPMVTPFLRFEMGCTSCHQSTAAEGVPGFMLRASLPRQTERRCPGSGTRRWIIGRRRKSDGLAGTSRAPQVRRSILATSFCPIVGRRSCRRGVRRRRSQH